MLCAFGIHEGGKREILSFRMADSEDLASWKGFLADLKARGLSGKRIKLISIFGSSSSRSGRRFLRELRDFLPFEIHAVQTDNGSEYLKELEKELEDVWVDHCFTYPRCPQQNARVERKTKSSQYEHWDHRLWGDDLEELNIMADEWNYIYNHVRPHQSLGYLTPAEFLRQWRRRSGVGIRCPRCSEPAYLIV